MLSVLLTVVHVVVAIFLVLVVLLQTGKRADLAGAFGGGGSQTAFGTRGAATVLSKATTAAAVMFMLTSLTLSIVSDRAASSSGSVLEGREVEAPETVPPLGDGSIEATPLDPSEVPLELLTSPVDEESATTEDEPDAPSDP